MEEDVPLRNIRPHPPSSSFQSKWELVDYGQGSSSEEEKENENNKTNWSVIGVAESEGEAD